jgi:hypothetical protein
MGTLNLALKAQPRRRRFLGRVAELVDRAIQQIVLFFCYYLPVTLDFLRPHAKGDIRAVHEGLARYPSGRHAINVIWQPDGTIPWYVLNVLEALKTQEVNTIVVANHDLAPGQLETLRPLCAEILVRGNKGLDFGAYQDAVLHVMRQHSPVGRLVLLNDSVFVFRDGLSELLTALLSDQYEVAAAYENWERDYHFQSFFIGFSDAVLHDPRVRDFWLRYRPISLRRWRIDHGEVQLSKVLRIAAKSFHVVYGVNELIDKLTVGDDWARILGYREFTPKPLRQLFPGDETLLALEEANPEQRALLLRRLKERLSDIFVARAQSHTGAFFFCKFVGSPILKRDLVFREIFSLYEVERMLGELGHDDHRQVIADDIRRRGSAAHLKGLAKRRYRLRLL